MNAVAKSPTAKPGAEGPMEAPSMLPTGLNARTAQTEWRRGRAVKFAKAIAYIRK
jgi:hypothetical protein